MKRLTLLQQLCILFSLVFLLGSVFLYWHFSNLSESIEESNRILQSEYEAEQVRYDTLVTSLDETTETFNRLLDSVIVSDGSDVVKTYRKAESDLTQALNTIETVLYEQWTWNDGERYATRRDRVQLYVTQDVLNGPYFDKGLDLTGGYRVDVLRMRGSFDSLERLYIDPILSDASVYVLYADFSYQLIKDYHPESEIDSSVSTNKAVYRFEYDRETGLIRNMESIGVIDRDYYYESDAS